MYSKILYNLLQNSHRVLNINECKVLCRNISRSRPITPERTPRRIPFSKHEEIVQEELLSAALENGKVPSIKDWALLKESVLTQGKIINDVNFDAKAISYCIAHKNYKAAKSLLQFYETKNEHLNIGALGKFLKLCHVCNKETRTLSKDDEELVLTIYKKIKGQHPIMATMTAENVIPALSLTKEWRKCLDLLENIKLSMRPSIASHSVVIKAAFENNEIDLGWELIHEMSSGDKFPHPDVYGTWLRKMNESGKDVVKTVKFLLKYFADYEILPTKEVTNQILDILKPFSYYGTYTTIDTKGTCSCCKQQLQKIKIDQGEFNQLKTVFMDNVIIGKNVFAKTNPEELSRFRTFLYSGEYDIVIDGLNVAYSAGNKQRPEVYGRLLANVVRHFRMKNKRILVLGRVHMNKWTNLDYIKTNSKMFLAQNLSQDDPFLLYATMASGLGTSFLSRDFMRGHLYLLMNSNLKRLFRKWQQLHQHSLIYAENNGQVHIKAPFPYLSTVQESKDGWHIPYNETYVHINPVSFEPPKNWLCIQKK